jgi:PTS hybrid protein
VSEAKRCEAEFKVANELGLHFRAAAMLVRTVSEFDCEISISNGDTLADARSVLDLMTLAASRGSTLRVTAKGVDAEAAVAAVGALIARNFAE